MSIGYVCKVFKFRIIDEVFAHIVLGRPSSHTFVRQRICRISVMCCIYCFFSVPLTKDKSWSWCFLGCQSFSSK